MTSRDNPHSRLIAWLKILLPLAALGILSTLFLFSRTIDPSRAIPYAKVDVKKLAQEPQITAPEYAGVTHDGTSVTVSAEVAKNNPGAEGAKATGLTARFETKGGARTEVKAAQGSVDPAKGLMALDGGVKITTSGGYSIDTQALTGSLDRTHLQSDSAVTATGPLGRIDAGSMVIDSQSAEGSPPGAYVLVFKGGVKLVYTPPVQGEVK